jgi:hypothetical protein
MVMCSPQPPEIGNKPALASCPLQGRLKGVSDWYGTLLDQLVHLRGPNCVSTPKDLRILSDLGRKRLIITNHNDPIAPRLEFGANMLITAGLAGLIVY